MCKNWGLSKLNAHEYKESIEEMKHADWLIERILFLDGLPNLQELGKIYIGENVPELLECDLRLENEAIPLLREAIAYSESVQDYGSRKIFQDILFNEEEHVDWLETQKQVLAQIGLENYLQSQL